MSEIDLARLNPLLIAKGKPRCRSFAPEFDPKYLSSQAIAQRHHSIYYYEDYDGGCVAFEAFPLQKHITMELASSEEPIAINRMGLDIGFLQQYAQIRYPLEEPQRQTEFSLQRQKPAHRSFGELFQYDEETGNVTGCIDGSTRLMRISVAPNFIKFGFIDLSLPVPEYDHLPKKLRYQVYRGAYPFDVPDIEVVVLRTGEFEIEFMTTQITPIELMQGYRARNQQYHKEFPQEVDNLPKPVSYYYQVYRVTNKWVGEYNGDEIYALKIAYGQPRLKGYEKWHPSDFYCPVMEPYFIDKPDGFLSILSLCDVSRYPKLNS